MKQRPLFCLIAFLQIIICSCKKTDLIQQGSISSVMVINATINTQPVVPDFSSTPVNYYSAAVSISSGSSNVYSIQSGQVPVTIAQITDTTYRIFKGSFNLKPTTIYSLFLAGQIAANGYVDTLLTIDHPPYYTASDSVAGVRFVNVSQGSDPISVDIQGNANGSEVSSLPYKGVTAFKAYPCTAANPASGQYVFEFRDAASGTLLTSYTYSNMARFHNVTIVFYGLPSSQSVFQVNNY